MPVSLLFAIKASLALTVFGLGLRVTPDDALYLIRRPALLARTVLTMNVVAPLFALMVAVAFGLHPAVKLGLVALALSPVPPILPVKAMNPSGEGSYACGVMIASSLLAIVTVPIIIGVTSSMVSAPMHVGAPTIARIVIGGVIIPFVIGVWVNRFAPDWSDNFHEPLASLAGVLLLVGLIPLAAFSWTTMLSLLGEGLLVAIVAMTATALAIGHFLGGPSQEDRTVLALATSSRHPAVALIIVKHVFPGDRLSVAAVLLALGAGAIASVAYGTWRRRRARRHVVIA